MSFEDDDPSVWNKLLASVQSEGNDVNFKRLLIAHLFDCG